MSSPPHRVATDPTVDPRPFTWGDGDRAVLLLHGLTGTPHEVRPLATALRRRGFTVSAPLLPGHTDLGALEASTWRDWYAGALEAFERLRDDGHRRVVVLGFSMGSLLALRLAALRDAEVAGVIAISVPLRFAGWKRRAIVGLARLRERRLLRDVVGILPKLRGPDVRIQREADDSPSLRAFPWPALAELVALQEEVEELLPHVRAPLLLLHGRFDHTTPPVNSECVAQRVASARVQLEILPGSFHIVGLDVDRDRAASEVVTFATSILGEPDPPRSPTPEHSR